MSANGPRTFLSFLPHASHQCSFPSLEGTIFFSPLCSCFVFIFNLYMCDNYAPFLGKEAMAELNRG